MPNSFLISLLMLFKILIGNLVFVLQRVSSWLKLVIQEIEQRVSKYAETLRKVEVNKLCFMLC